MSIRGYGTIALVKPKNASDQNSFLEDQQTENEQSIDRFEDLPEMSPLLGMLTNANTNLLPSPAPIEFEGDKKVTFYT